MGKSQSEVHYSLTSGVGMEKGNHGERVSCYWDQMKKPLASLGIRLHLDR